MRVGVEIGGTFTDLVLIDGDQVTVTKVRSTPASPDIGAFDALTSIDVPVGRLQDLGHGSTVATNAVLERKGARIAFVTTAGFRDILFLQRHDRRSIYDLAYAKPAPVVARRDCYEITERVLADGTVETPLDEDQLVHRLIPDLKAHGYDAIAICLLNAYANDGHERRVADVIRQHLPETFVTGSSDVIAEFREFERASTTTLAAFVQPVIDRYLSRFEDRLDASGFGGRFTVMQSNGGRLPAAAMRRNAITALFSGPAAGVVGAVRQIGRSGYEDLITFDMGGTSTDVCLVEKGQPIVTPDTEIDGLPIRTPVLDIVSVGSGGGSIVWVDEGGLMRVGPQSAGADPGPACYGFGGRNPTITDAQVICGAVRPAAFLGGRMKIDVEAARRAFVPIAETFSMTVDEAAEAAIRLANNAIVRAIQLVSTERGRDPRDYALTPFGGGGPLHAAHIAEELGITRIVVAPNPGVLSAYGLLASDYTKYKSVTRRMSVVEAVTDLPGLFAALRADLEAEFADLGLVDAADGIAFAHEVDMRFVGQAFEISVSVSAAELGALTEDVLRQGFEDAHMRVFFHAADGHRQSEVVALRVSATVQASEIQPLKIAREVVTEAGTGRIVDQGGAVEARYVPVARLAVREDLAGPVVIEGPTSTTYVPVGWTACLDPNDNLVMTRG